MLQKIHVKTFLNNSSHAQKTTFGSTTNTYDCTSVSACRLSLQDDIFSYVWQFVISKLITTQIVFDYCGLETLVDTFFKFTYILFQIHEHDQLHGSHSCGRKREPLTRDRGHQEIDRQINNKESRDRYTLTTSLPYTRIHNCTVQ